ncbi:radical SAM family heme chaperone HemW [Aegicerativicinus sediminis]|uniref:radical SAM family heme chaperone HemW n=1 Tax=Aegicerativicinus sediminis TaxID=2893202 RepID=UPI001E579817|nr:radical SAM family heme chaperone HemW [Aegicerativicinus sediminis]
MAGIYIHIPFCKQACFYCDFHFSTSLKHSGDMVEALMKEIQLRKLEVNEPIETIYFGGGTPSLFGKEAFDSLFQSLYNEFEISESAEITLEANPDDLSEEKIRELSNSPINRLSIGVQSFFPEHLKLMNRAHTTDQAHSSLKLATKYFENITVDLIYGIPKMTIDEWDYNLNQVLRYNIPHISCYALTVEPNTALASFIKKGTYPPVDETVALTHFDYLRKKSRSNGFVHYEISNLGLPGYFSKHNTSYWKGDIYLGIGPSAHSFDGIQRSWNISNNVKYLKAIKEGQLPSETEQLSITDRYNEYIMTGLRTIWGVSLTEVENRFGEMYTQFLMSEAQPKIEASILKFETGKLSVLENSRFLSDGIASDLFYIDDQ